MAKDLTDMSHANVTYDIMFIERHDLERPGSYYPTDHEKRALVDLATGGNDGNYPIHIEIAHQLLIHGRWWGRKDICCVQRLKGGKYTNNTKDSMWLDPPRDEKDLFKWEAWPLLTKAQKEHIIDIRNKCVEAERKWGFPAGTLTL